MANIRLKELVEANVDPKLVARSKETGKLVYFKNAQNKDAAMKAGTHLDPKDKKGDEPKADAKPNDMFGGDYAKDRGGEAPKDSDIADFNEPKARKQIIKDRNKLVQMNVGKDDKSLDFAIKLIDMLLDGELQAPNADTTKVASPNADVKSIIKGLLKTADKEFGHAWDLKDSSVEIIDYIYDEDEDGKELKARLEAGEDGTYVQTDEMEGTIVFNDGSQYQAVGDMMGDVNITKVGKEEPKTSSKLSTMMPKSKPTLNINSKNWKNTDGDGRMSFDAADDVRNHLNAVLGTDDGVAEVDFGSGNIQYSLSDGENSIYVGNDGGTYNVSFEGPSMDLDKIEQSYKSFKNPKDALQYAGELAKANKEGLEQKQDTDE
jgi:hypothetical protein